MAKFFWFFLCTYVISIAFSTPYKGSIVRRTAEVESSHLSNIAQSINATVIDHAGRDITSAFDVMVFYDSSTPSNATVLGNDTIPASNGTNKPMDRRSPLFYRQITHCSTPGTNFISSECSPTDNKQGGLQAYTVTCHRNQDIFHPYTAKFLYTLTFPVRRGGHCWTNEVCINSGSPSDGALNGHGVRFAYCVHRGAFRKIGSKSPIGLKLDKQQLKKDLEGKRLSMVASQKDLSTPVEVDRFDVEAEIAGNGDTENPGVIDRCKDCMELETQQFKKGTESLKAEAKLLTTGAMAGVLWLAIMSG